MNRNIGLQLIAYSFVLAGLSGFAYVLHSELGRPTLIAGLLGGALCLVWGFRATKGSTSKAPALLTMVGIGLVVLFHVVNGWFPSMGEGTTGRIPSAAVATVALVLTLLMVMRVAYAGVFGQATVSGTPRQQSA